MAQAARLQARQRLFNLVVTNVPGPQIPLYMLGRELEAIYPMVPLAENTALGIAIMSYNGQLNFGLVADYDALPDLEVLAEELRAAIEELVAAAGAAGRRSPRRRRARPRAPCPRPSERRDDALERVAIGVASLGSVVRADRAAVGVLRRPRPGRRLRRHGAASGRRSATRATPTSRPASCTRRTTPTRRRAAPHVPLPVTRDEAQLNDDQLLEALELGDVVIMYGDRAPAARPGRARRAAGGAVHAVARRRRAGGDPRPASGHAGLIGLAWTHMLRVSSPTDPLLRAFAAYWLGRGAP